jgi:hypothetical protein
VDNQQGLLVTQSGQSQLGKLFKSKISWWKISKWSYIINAIKGDCLLGFSPCIGFPQGTCIVILEAAISVNKEVV